MNITLSSYPFTETTISQKKGSICLVLRLKPKSKTDISVFKLSETEWSEKEILFRGSGRCQRGQYQGRHVRRTSPTCPSARRGPRSPWKNRLFPTAWQSPGGNHHENGGRSTQVSELVVRSSWEGKGSKWTSRNHRKQWRELKTVVVDTAANCRKIQHRDGFHQRTPHGGDKSNSTRRCSVYTNLLMASNRPRGSGDRLSRTSSNNKTSRRERRTPRLFFNTEESKKMFLIIGLATESSSATRKRQSTISRRLLERISKLGLTQWTIRRNHHRPRQSTATNKSVPTRLQQTDPGKVSHCGVSRNQSRQSQEPPRPVCGWKHFLFIFVAKNGQHPPLFCSRLPSGHLIFS